MVLGFEQDRNTWHLEHQYMLGDHLLVAPVIQSQLDSRQHEVYLPQGVWFDFWTKQRLSSSGKWISLTDVPIDTVPMWVKSGSMLVWAKERDRTFNVVGEVEKIELYGEREGLWISGIGDGETSITVRQEDGKCICEGSSYVSVSVYR